MIINNSSIGNAAHLYAQQNKLLESNRKVTENKSSIKNSKAAEVSLSAEAKELAKAASMQSGEKTEKLAKLKAEIKAGTYKPEAADIADSMLRHIWGGNPED